jgi:hypothetical protein
MPSPFPIVYLRGVKRHLYCEVIASGSGAADQVPVPTDGSQKHKGGRKVWCMSPRVMMVSLELR